MYYLQCLREQQFRLDPRRRLPPDIIAMACKYFPLYDPKEGSVTDLDVNMFYTTHMRDIASERRRQHRAALLKVVTDEEDRIALVKKKILLAEKSQKAVLFARAAAIANGTSHLVEEIVVSRETLRAEAAVVKVTATKAANTVIQKMEDYEDSTFEQLYHTNTLTVLPITARNNMKTKVVRAPPIARRNSIGDPTDIYNRVISVS